MVTDPQLGPHLAHWGINMVEMEKTEKTMAELQARRRPGGGRRRRALFWGGGIKRGAAHRTAFCFSQGQQDLAGPRP